MADPDAVAAALADPVTATKELLRIRPLVPVSSGRILLEEIGGLPAGTMVIVDAYSLHTDAALHPEPERFRPERRGPTFIPSGGAAVRVRPR